MGRWGRVCATEQGALDEAESCHLQGLALAQQAQEPGLICDSLSLAATCRTDADDLPAATHLLREASVLGESCHSHDLDRRLGDETARLLIALKEYPLAAQLLGFADAWIELHKIHLFGNARRDRERLKEQLAKSLGEVGFTRELTQGSQLSRKAFYTQLNAALEHVRA